MTDLWVLCEHGSPQGAHYVATNVRPQPVCPGGHRATVEEVVAWLEAKMKDWSTVDGNSTLPVVTK